MDVDAEQLSIWVVVDKGCQVMTIQDVAA